MPESGKSGSVGAAGEQSPAATQPKNLMVTARTSGPFLVYSPEVNGGPAFNYTLI